MKTVEEFWNEGMKPIDSRMQDIFKRKYLDNEIVQCATITIAGKVEWWAYIFRGDRAWFALKNGYRLPLSKVSSAINAISVDKMTVSNDELQKKVMLDAL